MKKFTLFTRKSLIIPNWKGLILLLIIFILIILGIIKFTLYNLYGFLEWNKSENAEILVVEGFLPDYAIDSAILLLNKNNYKLILTTGIPITKGQICLTQKNYAYLTANTLINKGIDSTKVKAVPSLLGQKDRTYTSALMVKQWLEQQKITQRTFNIMTLSAHSRRSLLLYQKAFGKDYHIGTVTVTDIEFEPKVWWETSEGVRTVIGEFIAYLYAKFFFEPEKVKRI